MEHIIHIDPTPGLVHATELRGFNSVRLSIENQ
jgi:hypothetical protein